MKESERVGAIRRELKALTEKEVDAAFKNLGVILADNEIPLKRKIDILVSEISEDPDDEPGLIYAGNVEEAIRKTRRK